MAERVMKFPKQFPSISRIITDNMFSKSLKNIGNNSKTSAKINSFYFYLSVGLSLIVVVVLSILTGFVVYNFSQNFVKFQTNLVARQEIKGKINFWSSIADKYSGYPDAYFNMSLLYFRLEDFRQSRSYLDKTLLLNPDYNGAKKLDLALRSKGY